MLLSSKAAAKQMKELKRKEERVKDGPTQCASACIPWGQMTKPSLHWPQSQLNAIQFSLKYLGTEENHQNTLHDYSITLTNF
jgi:hypothetical protein